MNEAPRLLLKSTKDALLLVEAAERGIFPRLVRRLSEQERSNLIRSGSIFVYDEFESGIKRFTDTLVWSPSRIVGNYLVYREMRKHEPRPASRAAATLPPQPPSTRSLARPRPELGLNESERARKRREQIYVGSLTNSEKFKSDGLVKRTFSLICEGKHIHVIAYYTYEDAMNERFETPSEHKDFADLTISPDLLKDMSAFRFPPRIEKLSNGKPAYAGEDIDKLDSPHSVSTPLDTDRESPTETTSTYESPNFPTLPPIDVPSEEMMFGLPPLRPIPSRSHPSWNETPVPSLAAYDNPAYSTQTRSDLASYSSSSFASTPSLAAISVPSLTPLPARQIPRLRDGRQHPYPQRTVNISRTYRETEHTPTTPVLTPNEEPPPYPGTASLWMLSRPQQEMGSPMIIRPSLAAEVGPSGERVEYDVPEHWTPNTGMSLLYPDTPGPQY
ncbi:hypothetical protein FRC07_011214 [Ceratobasidium sp. 392]|nr:hypothetical protein FRC07_011214 [Ceratobasidium sp. 392]